MIPKPLNEITDTDLEQLIRESRSEDRTIEYKQSVPGNADSEKIPWLLKPVCSFANSDGGDLILGITAQEGIPQEISGFEAGGIDQLKLTLEHVLQSGIEPQLRGVGIREVLLSTNKHALVVRVPKSWISPHRVKNNARFYARNSAGSYELDVSQIKQSFFLSETLAERLRNFRADRIAAAMGNSSPVPLKSGLKVILHVIPLVSLISSTVFSVSQYESLYDALLPVGGGNIDYHLNFDGLVTASGIEANGYRAYTQMFRSGILEFVRVYEPQGESKYFPSADYETVMMRNFKAALGVFRQLEVVPPIYVALTVASGSGYRLLVGENTRFFTNEPRPIDRDVLAVPELELNSFEGEPHTLLRPLFDYIWNACGYRGSLNYDGDGSWRPCP